MTKISGNLLSKNYVEKYFPSMDLQYFGIMFSIDYFLHKSMQITFSKSIMEPIFHRIFSTKDWKCHFPQTLWKSVSIKYFHKLCGSQFSIKLVENKIPLEFGIPLADEFTLQTWQWTILEVEFLPKKISLGPFICV